MKEILQDPYFGFGLAVFSIVMGIITSAYYYQKGKRDGDKTADGYKEQLQKANIQIDDLKKQLSISNDSLARILKKAEVHDAETDDIKQMIKAGQDIDTTSERMLNHFELLVKQEKFREAENYFHGIKAKIESPFMLNYMASFVARNAGDYKTCIASLKQCLSLEPENTKIELLLGDYYLNVLNDPLMALESYMKLKKKFPEDTQILKAIAYSYWGLRKKESALEYYNTVARLDPSDPVPFDKMAMIYASASEFEKALNCIETALAKGINLPAYYVCKGYILKEQGDLKAAQELFKEALQLIPESKELMCALIEVYNLKKDFDHADRLCTTYLTMYPNETESDFFIRVYFQTLTHRREFKKLIAYARTLHLNHNQSHMVVISMLIAQAYMELQDFEKAGSIIERIAGHAPDTYDFTFTLLNYYINKPNPNYGKGLELLERIEGILGVTSETIMRRGYICLYLERFDLSMELCNEALKLNPDNQLAIEIRSAAAHARLVKMKGFPRQA